MIKKLILFFLPFLFFVNLQSNNQSYLNDLSELAKTGNIEIILSKLEERELDNESKFQLIWLVNAHFKKAENIENIFQPIFEIAQNNADFKIKLVAIATCNEILSHLKNNGQNINDLLAEYQNFLTQLVANQSEFADVRRAGIKGIEYLSLTEVKSKLLEFIAEPNISQNPPFAKSVCSALAHFEMTEAIPQISKLLQTDDENIFATAIIALTTLNSKVALKLILQNEHKFGGKFCSPVLNNMENFIADILIKPESDLTIFAVRAAKYLYKSDYREQLISILYSTENKKIKKEILQQLLQILDKQKAAEICQNIANNPFFTVELSKLKYLANSNSVEHKKSNLQTVSQNNGRPNLTTQEYADPGYVENSLWWIGMSWLGHTAFFSGMDADHILRVVEVCSLSYAVHDNTWDVVNDNPDYEYWGVFTPNNVEMTFQKRKDVMNTAVWLIGEDIGYPVFPDLDLLRHTDNPGERIEPNEITDLRCDGLIEYAFEYNDIMIWGENGTSNPQNFDVCNPANVEAHNDFYSDEDGNPNTELAPIVQCGIVESSSTYLTDDSIPDLPEYNVIGFTQNGSDITLTVSATDRSGIHYFGYFINNEWHYSTTQPQHPNSDTFTDQITFTMYEPDFIYFFAIDNGGNYPEYAEEIYLDITPSEPTYFINQNFDEEWPPQNWSGDFGNDDWHRNGSYAHSGAECANYDSWGDGRTGNLFTPIFDLSNSISNKLNFWYMSKLYDGWFGDYWNHLKVYTSTNGNDWQQIVHLQNVENWNHYTLDLEEDIIQIKFVGIGGYAETHDADTHLDDVQIYGIETNNLLYGDVDGNGEVQAMDASLTLLNAVGMNTFDDCQTTAADVNVDGNVSAFDASLILQFAVGIIDEFPLGRNFK